MKWLSAVALSALLAASTAPDAFGWGVYHGAYGGAAYRGPMGATAVRGPYGGAAVRGPYGGTAYRPPGTAPIMAAPLITEPITAALFITGRPS